MATLTLPNGTVLTQVSRASCLARVAAIPLGVIPYSQTTISTWTDRRGDCTGWLCHALATPKSGPGIYLHGYNTGSFYTEDVIERIDWADLRPGDLVGYFAANSPGNGGHGAVWMDGERRPDGRFQVSDHGSGMGPKLRWVKWDGVSTGWLAPTRPDGSRGLAAWRYVAIVEEGDMTKDELLAALREPTDPLARALRAVAWQYAGGGIPAGMSTLGVLESIRATVAVIAARVDIDPTELAAIEAAARGGAQAGVVASADELAAAVVARLPGGALTSADVAAAVREVLLHGAA